jgi:hypothetical protein
MTLPSAELFDGILVDTNYPRSSARPQGPVFVGDTVWNVLACAKA